MAFVQTTDRPRMLVAGIGNIFYGDDGFGVEVAQRLAALTLPAWVRVEDVGLRGLHLAFELLDERYDVTVIVDAARRGGPPGAIYLIDPDVDGARELDAGAAADSAGAHGMNVEAMLAFLARLGGVLGRVLVVGCEPGIVDETVGLSPPVRDAVDEAVRLIVDIIEGAAYVSGHSRADRRDA